MFRGEGKKTWKKGVQSFSSLRGTEIRGSCAKGLLTIDGNSNALGQSEAVLANKGGDLAEAIGLQVLSISIAKLDLRDLELEVVGLRNRLDGDGAGVVLERKEWTGQ